MSYYNVQIEICAGDFQKFDQGERIRDRFLPQYFKKRDAFWWSCAQFTGMAVIVEVDKEKGFLIEKTS